MTQRTLNFAAVLGPASELTPAEIDGVLALGYAMANANGHASFDELESVRALAKHVRPGVAVATILDGLASALDGAESIGDYVRAVAARLERDVAREAAYKAAYAIAVFDLETNEDERELDDLLIEVLKLSSRVDQLEADVNEALMG
jgi:hypothetical protein